MRVYLILVDQLAETPRLVFLAGIFDRKDLVISCRGDIKNIFTGVLLVVWDYGFGELGWSQVVLTLSI